MTGDYILSLVVSLWLAAGLCHSACCVTVFTCILLMDISYTLYSSISFVQTLFIQTIVLQDTGQHGNPKRVFFLDSEVGPTLLTKIEVHL